MGVVLCARCCQYADLDYHVDDMVVASNGIDWLHLDCLTEEEREIVEKDELNAEALPDHKKGDPNK